jgi:hypothetical protein
VEDYILSITDKAQITSYLLSCLILAGYMDGLSYAHIEGCPWDVDTCLQAEQSGKVDCLDYALANGYDKHWYMKYFIYITFREWYIYHPDRLDKMITIVSVHSEDG